MCEEDTRMKIYQDSQHSKDTFDRMSEMMMRGKFCDVVIVLDNQRIPVHGNVMAANCEYINLNLDGKCNGTSPAEIVLNDVDHDSMKKIIEYCYSGNIVLEKNNVEKVMNAAVILQSSSVLNVCCRYFKGSMNPYNCFNVLKLANLYGCNDLMDVATDYIQFNFTEISQTDAFLNVQVETLIELLSFDDLNVSVETVVLEGVKRWIKHDMPNRKQHLKSLYEQIKLPFLPSDVLFKEAKSLCEQELSCTDLVLEAIQWQLMPTRRATLGSNRTKSRKSTNVTLIIGNWETMNASIVEIYDSSTNTWFELMDLATYTRHFTSVLVGNKLITIGGIIGSLSVKDVVLSNLKTGTRTNLPSMQDARCYISAVHLFDCIYVPGGYDGANCLRTVEKYDLETQKWSYAASMPTARREAISVVLGNEFFVIGGFDMTEASNATEAYCPLTGKWRMCASCIVARASPGVATVDGLIYAVGGYGKSNMVIFDSAERYDPKLDVWIEIENMFVPRYGISLCRSGNNLLAISGKLKNSYSTIVEEYDTFHKKWRPLASLNNGRAHFNSISVSTNWVKRLKSIKD